MEGLIRDFYCGILLTRNINLFHLNVNQFLSSNCNTALFFTLITAFIFIFYRRLCQPCYFCFKPNMTCSKDGFAVSPVLQLKSKQLLDTEMKPYLVSNYRVGP